MESNRIVAARSARQVALWHAQRVQARQYRELCRIYSVVGRRISTTYPVPPSDRVKVDA